MSPYRLPSVEPGDELVEEVAPRELEVLEVAEQRARPGASQSDVRPTSTMGRTSDIVEER